MSIVALLIFMQSFALAATCPINGPSAVFDRTQHMLKLKAKEIEVEGQVAELQVMRSSGDIEVYRGKDFKVGTVDGNDYVYLTIDGQVTRIPAPRIKGVAVAPPGAGIMGKIDTIKPPVPMGASAIEATALASRGKLVVVITADGNVRQGYLQKLGERYYVTRDLNGTSRINPTDFVGASEITSVQPRAMYPTPLFRLETQVPIWPCQKFF